MTNQAKIMITGVNGFVGKHLAHELSARGHRVVGVGVSESQANPLISEKLDTYIQCDITDVQSITKLPLGEVSAVINLAGLANVGASFANPELYMDVNVKVLTVLGEALFKQNPAARILAVSTGALYDSEQSMPLTENSALATKASPYAQSKKAMEKEAEKFRERGFDCIIVRPFNHIGPGQGLGFLVPDMVQKIMNCDRKTPRITVGNIHTVRDYTDVRDIAKAYADLATASNLEDSLYNVCSGNGRSGEEILQLVCSSLSVNYADLQLDVDQSLIRPTDPARIIGSSRRLQDETGWSPTIKLEQTVNDIVKELL